jgi:hypothetical protein
VSPKFFEIIIGKTTYMSQKQQIRFPLRTKVEVDWVDSTSRGRWATKTSYLDCRLLRCRTAGYLLVKNREKIIVVQSLCDNGDMTDSMAIPRSCVTKIRRLR